MRIIIIGGRGTVGKRVAERFSRHHEVLTAGRSGGDLRVDISEAGSIAAMFHETKNIDAVICAAGEVRWDIFENLAEDDYLNGIRSKLMGQVNLVRIGQEFITEGGSVTLSSGILADDPVAMTSAAAQVNGALHSFVRAAAPELKRGLRLNVVSAGLVADAAAKYGEFFPGHDPVPMQRVVNGYVRSVEGYGSGEVIRVYQ
jgi:NAD(P)-dependent dehydrogenase (short-subunit alcohol dehydrogenase family)